MLAMTFVLPDGLVAANRAAGRAHVKIVVMTEDVVHSRLGHVSSDRDLRTSSIVEIGETAHAVERAASPCAGCRE
jgi:hypothetical protein